MRKKIISVLSSLIFIILLSSFFNIDAKVLESIGQYYKTNIKAYVNGLEIESYNIGGKTLICIEDLKEYGFNTKWDEKNKTVSADINEEIIKLKENAISLHDLYIKAIEVDWIGPTTPFPEPMTFYEGDIIPKGITMDSFRLEEREQIEINFRTKLNKEYVNSNYFPILENNLTLVSDKFDYIYNENSQKLIIKPKKQYINYNNKITVYLLPEIQNNIGEKLGNKYSFYATINTIK